MINIHIGLAVFIFGMLIGVFLHNCIYRIPAGESILKRPYVNKPITKRFFIVLLLTPLIYLGFYTKYGLGMQFIAFSFIFSILLIVSFIDIDYRIIPDGLVLTALIGGAAVFILNLFKPFAIYGDRLWWNPLAGMFPGSVFLLLMALIGTAIYKSDEAMGMGDVKIFAPIGLFLGWRMCILALLIAVLIGGIAGILMIFSGKKKRRDTIPFGPYIVAGAYLAAMWGWDITSSYFNLL